MYSNGQIVPFFFYFFFLITVTSYCQITDFVLLVSTSRVRVDCGMFFPPNFLIFICDFIFD